MRTIRGSNGLALGPDEGPWIDAIALDTHPVALEEVTAAVLLQSNWTTWNYHTTPVTKGFTGVFTISHGLNIRFLWRQGADTVVALRAIEQHEGGLPHALAGAILAAAQSKLRPTSTPFLFAMACHTSPHTRHVSSISSKEIDGLVMSFIASLPNGGGQHPVAAVDRARFFLRLGRKLWDTEVLRFLSVRGLFDEKAALFIGGLAAASLHMDQPDAVVFGSVKLPIPSDDSIFTVWPQVLEWHAGQIQPDTLRYITRGTMPSDGELTIDRVIGVDTIPPTPDPSLINGLTRGLLRDAEEKGVYQPAGNFTLALPEGYPLRDWGVHELRISASPAGLWCAVVDKDNKVGASFQWVPHQPLRRWVVTEPAEPVINVTLAALWRDLRVAGESAVPPQDGPRIAQQGPAKPQRQKGASGRPDVTHRYLPRSGARYITGSRQWGNAEEREIIKRQAHGVGPHLRKAKHHSKYAEDNADDYGWIILEGHTFVKPHTRGRGETTVERQVIVHAKGLATVMALL